MKAKTKYRVTACALGGSIGMNASLFRIAIEANIGWVSGFVGLLLVVSVVGMLGHMLSDYCD